MRSPGARKRSTGTTERLAFALLFYTGQRRSNVVAMSWANVKDGTICVTSIKTKRTSGIKLPKCWASCSSLGSFVPGGTFRSRM